MLNTSGTYNFQSITAELIIREAFENIGLAGAFNVPEKLDSARRIIDLLLLEWENKSINLWTLQYSYLSLAANQGVYTLPTIVSKVVQAMTRMSTRQNNAGTPTATDGGDAANAFDGNPTTNCDAGIDGSITYDYGLVNASLTGNQQIINFIGIQSETTTTYSLLVEYSQDGATWLPLQTIPAQNYDAGITSWFDITSPIVARAYRISETDGAILDVIEIYFNNQTVDTPVIEISRWDYTSWPQKGVASRPNMFYFNRGMIPTLYLLPIPSNTYNCLLYSYIGKLQDVGSFYTNTVQVPSQFYPTLINGLSWKLAVKYAPQLAPALKIEYDQSFLFASNFDAETVPLSINIDYS